MARSVVLMDLIRHRMPGSSEPVHLV